MRFYISQRLRTFDTRQRRPASVGFDTTPDTTPRFPVTNLGHPRKASPYEVFAKSIRDHIHPGTWAIIGAKTLYLVLGAPWVPHRGALKTFRSEESMASPPTRPIVSLMLAVPDAPKAAAWYKEALGATELWNFGAVIGLEIAGAPFFLGEPASNGWESPTKLGTTTTRVEVFCDDPDALIERAVNAGADGSIDKIRNHEAPWGPHRQGGFVDPFGHRWLVGDRSPLDRYP